MLYKFGTAIFLFRENIIGYIIYSPRFYEKQAHNRRLILRHHLNELIVSFQINVIGPTDMAIQICFTFTLYSQFLKILYYVYVVRTILLYITVFVAG